MSKENSNSAVNYNMLVTWNKNIVKDRIRI